MSNLFLHSVYYGYGAFIGAAISIVFIIIHESIRLYKEYKRIQKWRRDRFN